MKIQFSSFVLLLGFLTVWGSAQDVVTGDEAPGDYRALHTPQTRRALASLSKSPLSFSDLQRFTQEMSHPVQSGPSDAALETVMETTLQSSFETSTGAPYYRFGTALRIEIVDGEGLPSTPEQRARLIRMLATIPTDHLTGLEKIVLHRSGSPFIVQSGTTITTKTIDISIPDGPLEKLDPAFLNASLAIVLGNRYYRTVMSTEEKALWRRTVGSELDYDAYFGLIYFTWLYDTRAILDITLKNKDTQTLKALIFISTLFKNGAHTSVRTYETENERNTRLFTTDYSRTDTVLTLAGYKLALHGGILTGPVDGDPFDRPIFDLPTAVLNRIPRP